MFLGKTPASPLKQDTVKYSDLTRPLRAKGLLPKVPLVFGHGHDFQDGEGANSWQMLGNGPDDSVFSGFQGCGDCTWAGPGHAEMEAAKNSGRPVPPFSGKTIVDQYSAFIASTNNGQGYDPQTGANDNGCDPQQVLQWRQTKGLLDDNGVVYKIGQVVALTPGNLDELWEAAYLFENAGIGVSLQDAQEDQFNANQPWDYVASSATAGGHWIEVMGRAAPNDGGLITWGKRQSFTQSFYTHLNDESYCYVDPMRYSVITGETAEHYRDQDLEKYLALVAQLKSA